MLTKTYVRWLCCASISTALATAITSCSDVSRLTPEATAKQWIESGIEGDVDRLVSLTCYSKRDAVRVMGEVSRRSAERLNPSTTKTKEELADLDFQVVSGDAETALVRVGYLDSGMHLIQEDGEWHVCPPTGPED